MKKYLTLTLLFAFLHNGFCKAGFESEKNTFFCKAKENSLDAYKGRFQKDFHGKMFYLNYFVENGELKGIQLWDNQKMTLKHLSGDNFIVSGLDWSVKFIRDKTGKIVQVLVMGKDLWNKVKS